MPAKSKAKETTRHELRKGGKMNYFKRSIGALICIIHTAHGMDSLVTQVNPKVLGEQLIEVASAGDERCLAELIAVGANVNSDFSIHSL